MEDTHADTHIHTGISSVVTYSAVGMVQEKSDHSFFFLNKNKLEISIM